MLCSLNRLYLHTVPGLNQGDLCAAFAFQANVCCPQRVAWYGRVTVGAGDTVTHKQPPSRCRKAPNTPGAGTAIRPAR